jgi:translation elongation factor EF-G
LLERIPAPLYDPEHPLQALVTNLDASPYVGRLALCRVRHGNIRKGQQIAWCRADGTIQKAQVAELYVTDALDRVDAEEAGPGEIIAVAGIAEVTIGETLADPAAAGDHGRRTGDVDHDRREHIAAGGERREQADGAADRGAVEAGARRQRFAARTGDGKAGHV